MSLRTDIIFVKALMSNESLVSTLPAHGIHNSYAYPDIDLENEPLPYIVVNYDGMQNDGATKDGFEGDSDRVQISILLVTKSREELASMAENVRTTIRSYFAEHRDDEDDGDFALIPFDYQFTAGEVGYDPAKPCCRQLLSYDCDTDI